MTEKLKEYVRKRDFNITSEPKASTEHKKQASLKFVIQHHIARKDHFDFRIEWQGVLLSWAVPKGPSFNPKDKRLAIQVEDHPLNYRNFEGTIPKGEYGGGVVMLWDEGSWSPLYDVRQGLAEGRLKFVLNGKRLKGGWALIMLKGKENKNNWILLKEKDEYSLANDGISNFKTSIRTGRTMQEIEKGKKGNIIKNPFQELEVQRVQSKKVAPESNDWVYEIKYDGYRIIAFIENNEVRLITRNNNNFTSYFNNIANALVSLSGGRSMVLDGEIAITDKAGKTDFQLLQNHMKNTSDNPTYIVFDLLALDGKDLRKKPLIERKRLLKNILKNSPESISYSTHTAGNGKEIFHAICNMDFEGIVGKKVNSIYSGVRNGDWIKLKCRSRQEFVVGGYTLTGKKTSGVSSLLLGHYDEKKLIFAGRAGTGMTHKMSTAIEEMLDKISQKECPFIHTPKTKKGEKVIYVKPLIVVEIQFAGWTQDNLLRQASFKGIREDKNAKEVVREISIDELNVPKESNQDWFGNKPKKTQSIKLAEKQNKDGTINFGEITISSPNKLFYNKPKIKKIDVVRYYSSVAKKMLPFLEGRLISIVRCPKGISEPCFFKKHPNMESKGIVPLLVETSEGKKTEFYYIENINGLIQEAQMCTLEFHTWGSKVNNLDKPDIMVFDLDPHEGLDLKQVQQGVIDLKSVLDELSLVSFLKTSGGKGYHIVVPFKPSANWDKFYEFSKKIAEVMVQNWEDRYTNNIRKKNRRNKIFIDFMRNGKGATSIAPYSLRAREGAPVSMPIFWEELNTIAPNDIKMSEALKRLNKPDPWKNFFNINQEIKL